MLNGEKMKQRGANSGNSRRDSNGIAGIISDGSGDYSDQRKQQDGGKRSRAGISAPFSVINNIILPLLIVTLLPTGIMMIVYSSTDCDGSLSTMISRIQNKTLYDIYMELWGNYLSGISFFTFAVVFGYYIWAILCTRMIPGKIVKGPLTPMGNIPEYVDNGLSCYIITMAGLIILTVILKLNNLTPTIVIDQFGELAAFMHIYSFIVVFFLYIKGIYSPSSSDSGKTGKGFMFDYYWGTELYPRVYGVDIKVLTNCRFALTVWPILVYLCAIKSYELHGFVDSMIITTVLQLFYITKFFYWEAGYYGTMDISQDRAGFYIIWGCMSLVPPLYPLASYYLVNHPVRIGPVWTTVILVVGIASTTVNYLADHQKQIVRKTNGNCKIWGRNPDIIRAKYRTESGNTRESILLTSGWWGLSRHFHYVPEILLAFCWTVPAGFENLLPYMYIIFLTVLLVHRSFRDEKKCSTKYGEYWQKYCLKVKYRIIPYVF